MDKNRQSFLRAHKKMNEWSWLWDSKGSHSSIQILLPSPKFPGELKRRKEEIRRGEKYSFFILVNYETATSLQPISGDQHMSFHTITNTMTCATTLFWIKKKGQEPWELFLVPIYSVSSHQLETCILCEFWSLNSKTQIQADRTTWYLYTEYANLTK